MKRTLSGRARMALLGFFVAAAGVLVACGAGGGGSTVPDNVCPLPSGLQVALAYPVPGTSSAPDAFGQVVIAVSSPLPNWTADILYPNNELVYGSTALAVVSPSAIPTPYATPSFGNPVYESSTFTGINAGQDTTLNVLLSPNAIACTIYQEAGTFTTQ